MTLEDRIWKLLREDYGITNLDELDRAILKQRKLDISILVVPGEEKIDGQEN